VREQREWIEREEEIIDARFEWIEGKRGLSIEGRIGI